MCLGAIFALKYEFYNDGVLAADINRFNGVVGFLFEAFSAKADFQYWLTSIIRFGSCL